MWVAKLDSRLAPPQIREESWVKFHDLRVDPFWNYSSLPQNVYICGSVNHITMPNVYPVCAEHNRNTIGTSLSLLNEFTNKILAFQFWRDVQDRIIFLVMNQDPNYSSVEKMPEVDFYCTNNWTLLVQMVIVLSSRDEG